MRKRIGLGLLVMSLALAACSTPPPVVPTLAQLPSVTPPPTFTPLPPPTATPLSPSDIPQTPADAPTEGAPFVTDTPDGQDEPTAAPIFTTPTPESFPSALGGGSPAPCSAQILEAQLLELDLETLSAAHEAFMAALRAALAAPPALPEGWVLVDEPDPLAGTMSADALPLGSLRFRRGSSEMLVLVSAMHPEVRDFYSACIGEEAYLRQGDVSEQAVIELAPLAFGQQAVRAQIEEPVLDEAGTPTGETLSTALTLVLTDNALIQTLSIPTLDETLGREPVSDVDADALLAALVGIIASVEVTG
ncbi:MAG: hypothetical protein Kow0077_10900 [Anaerolineae bacterium]